jgi:hypothetical protein
MERQSFKPNNPEQREQLIAARRKLADEILAYINVASAGDIRRAVWILSSALQAKMLRPKGKYIGRNWYSDHDQLVFVKPTGNQPYRQREFCCSARFLFLLCESLDVQSIDALFDAAVHREPN